MTTISTFARGLAMGLALSGSALAAQQDMSGRPDNRPVVAVMYFTNGAIGRMHQELAPLSKGLTDMLITELQGNEGVRIVERDQLEAIIKEQNLSAGERVSQETAVRIGKLLGAGHMIFGTFVSDPKGRLRMDVRAVNTETAQIAFVTTTSGTTEDVLDMLGRLGTKINKDMKLPLNALRPRDTGMAPGHAPGMPHTPGMPRATHTAEAQKTQMPMQAVLLYSRAIAAKDRGDRTQAVELFNQVLSKFPKYEPAQEQLQSLQKPAAAPSGS